MMRISSFQIPTNPLEEEMIYGTTRSFANNQRNGLIFCHGSGGSAVGSHNAYLTTLFEQLYRNFTIHSGDLGFQSWGSQVVVDRMNNAANLLRDNYGSEEKVTIIGASMGGCSALNYAYRYPERVKSLALLIPLTSLKSARENPWLTSRWPELDAIYGEPPNNDYSENSPIEFVDKLDPNIPMKIWYSTDDGLVYQYTVNDFIQARPQTLSVNMGAVGHSIPQVHYPDIVKFVLRHIDR